MVSPSAPFNSVVASLMLLRVSAFLEIVALASVGTAWLFFFNTSAQDLLLWSALNFYAILPVIVSFVVLGRARSGPKGFTIGLVGVFVALEMLNLFASGSALGIFIVNFVQCELPLCTQESLLLYLIVESSVIVVASLIGIISAGVSLNLYRKLPPSSKTKS
jgi:hypothetical protein